MYFVKSDTKNSRIAIRIPKKHIKLAVVRNFIRRRLLNQFRESIPNHGIDVLAGVVDSGYRGEICALLVNLGDKNFSYRKGDRIAQIIIEKCHDVEWKEVKELRLDFVFLKNV